MNARTKKIKHPAIQFIRSKNNPIKFEKKEFEVVGALGRGAYSFVYKVAHRKKKSLAALKVIDKKKIKTSNSLKRLQNEISIQKIMKNKNVVKLFKYFQDQSNHYLLIEYCANGEFYKLLKKEGTLSIKKAKVFGIQIARAIRYIHSLGIIHRDLKPGNIFIDSENQIVKEKSKNVENRGLRFGC